MPTFVKGQGIDVPDGQDFTIASGLGLVELLLDDGTISVLNLEKTALPMHVESGTHVYVRTGFIDLEFDESGLGDLSKTYNYFKPGDSLVVDTWQFPAYLNAGHGVAKLTVLDVNGKAIVKDFYLSLDKLQYPIDFGISKGYGLDYPQYPETGKIYLKFIGENTYGAGAHGEYIPD